jgi:hypothetical protein
MVVIPANPRMVNSEALRRAVFRRNDDSQLAQSFRLPIEYIAVFRQIVMNDPSPEFPYPGLVSSGFRFDLSYRIHKAASRRNFGHSLLYFQKSRTEASE